MLRIQVLGLCFAFTVALHSEPQTDDYNLSPVKAAMSVPSLSVSFIERQIHRMGDGMGIALLKIYSPDELRDEKLATAYLPLIRMAFSYPEAITRPEDHKPDVTLFFLKSLNTDNWSPALKEEAADLISFLETGAENRTRRK